MSKGNTVPFIARYRKEKTGGLNEEQIREIEKIYEYGIHLNKRKEDTIRLIEEKGMMNDSLKESILACDKISDVENLYRPYKEKKKTRASIAKANGLEPFSKWMLSLPWQGNVESEARKYLNENVSTVEEAIAGAEDIIAENMAENVRYRKYLKDILYRTAFLVTKVKKNNPDESRTYQMYYDYQERLNHVVPHRILAINRAMNEKIIRVSLSYDEERAIEYIVSGHLRGKKTIVEGNIRSAVNDGFKRLLYPSIEREIHRELTEKAQDQALLVFSKNLERLLMQPPLKDKIILGVDPAYRTGCKLAVIDKTNALCEIAKIYPTLPKKDYSKDKRIVLNLINKYHVEIIAIGNGTASRETEQFIADLIKEYHLNVQYVIVSEAGASVYSASPLAKEEFPDLVVEERSAVSIARRLQDPLAELVKIEPKAISVGQYQHDMDQKKLEEQLDFVVLKAVNQVGVNINTASPSLLKYVSGCSNSIAKSIVAYRNKQGKFKNREEIRNVPRLGPKSYEQTIGFLRIMDGDNPLDKTSIHPESYFLVNRLLADLNLTADDLGSDILNEKLNQYSIEELSDRYGTDHYTMEDIAASLKQPLRTPRDEYQTALLRFDILKLEDLHVGDQLEGTVRNVVDFGAFVDIGLKNDGLVHISKMSKERIRHPLDVVNVGDIVQVYVDSIDLDRKKVSLSFIKDK